MDRLRQDAQYRVGVARGEHWVTHSQQWVGLRDRARILSDALHARAEILENLARLFELVLVRRDRRMAMLLKERFASGLHRVPLVQRLDERLQ